MATFLVIGFVMATAEAVVDLLRLTVCVADFGTVDFQGAISQAARCCTLTLAGHVPPGPRGQNQIVRKEIVEKKRLVWTVDRRHKPEFTFNVAGIGDDRRSGDSMTSLVRHHHSVRLSATQNLPLADS